MGAVETLICWENLDIQRVGWPTFFRLAKQSPKHHQNIIGPSSKRHQNVIKTSPQCYENIVTQVTLKNHASGEEKILFLNSEQEKDKTLYTDQVN